MTGYVIRGGEQGKARLHVIAEALAPETAALLVEAGIAPGMRCLDVGCGGGEVSIAMAEMVGASGRVVGIDMDPVKVELAGKDAAGRGLLNVEFRAGDATALETTDRFDLVYARFLLTHVADPDAALALMVAAVEPGGLVVVEDLDHTAVFSYPPSPALERYVELYDEVARQRGGDPAIGPKLPGMLRRAGVDDLVVRVLQPVFMTGDAKRIHQITLVNVADALTAAGMATAEDIEALGAGLGAYADDADTMISFPRIFQVHGRKPSNVGGYSVA